MKKKEKTVCQIIRFRGKIETFFVSIDEFASSINYPSKKSQQSSLKYQQWRLLLIKTIFYFISFFQLLIKNKAKINSCTHNILTYIWLGISIEHFIRVRYWEFSKIIYRLFPPFNVLDLTTGLIKDLFDYLDCLDCGMDGCWGMDYEWIHRPGGWHTPLSCPRTSSPRAAARRCRCRPAPPRSRCRRPPCRSTGRRGRGSHAVSCSICPESSSRISWSPPRWRLWGKFDLKVIPISTNNLRIFLSIMHMSQMLYAGQSALPSVTFLSDF